MDKLRRFLSNWLGFSRTEVNGFLILLPLIIIWVISEPLYRKWNSEQLTDFTEDEKLLDSLSIAWANGLKTNTAKKESVKMDTVFSFDPNTIDEKGLISLGFSKRLSEHIASYRQNGGVFRIKRDLLKIYGMDSTLYHQLYAYIRLPENKEERKKEVGILSSTSKKTFVAFDINLADTTQLKTIHGIGNVLAARIIKFRNSLGGFIDLQQINEVYGIDSLVAARVSASSYVDKNFEPQKININTVDEKTLVSHPYLKKSQIKAIKAYRFQHGDFSDIRDLLKISIIPPREAERLIPYLKVKD